LIFLLGEYWKSSFPAPRQLKRDVRPGIRLSCKVNTSLEVPRLLSGFTSIRKGAEIPSILEVFSQGAELGARLVPLLGGMHQEGANLRVTEAFNITPAQILQSPLLKDIKRTKQKNNTRGIK